MKLSIAHKLSLSSIFLVLMSAGIVGWVFHTQTTNILVDNALKRIALDVQEAGNTLQQIINTHDEDVLFLANTSPFQGMIRSRSGVDKKDVKRYSQWVSRMQTVFESLLERKIKYHMIRFIDQQGNELVSISRTTSGIVRVKEKQLQNKSHRPYVHDTLKLARGEIYLSEINLNREFGKVQIPYLEVVRIATPIFDDRNNKRAGLVVITVEIGKDLRAIQRRVNKSGDDRVIYITNDRGGYLLHPDSELTYGFDLEKRYRIQEDIPQLAGEFLPTNSRKQLTLMPENGNGRDVVNFTKIPFDTSHPERFIAVVMTQDYMNIVAKQSEVLKEIVLWIFLLALAGAGLVVLFSIRITRPIQQMTRAVNEFSHNKHLLTISLPVTLGDEVGVLARSFNDMIQQVKHSQDRLEDMNIHLESRVVARTEELNVALIEAERANSAKSEFLSRMSHELRTPLNAILGFAQMLELNSSTFTQTQKGNVKEILDAGDHLLNLINEVLNLAQIESGKLEINMEVVKLNDVLKQCFTLIKTSLDEKNIELVDEITCQEFAVNADSFRLKQILLNVLSNAIKYNKENGSIILKYNLVNEKHIRLSITDTGKGLTTDEISMLFTPFERLDVEHNIEGTGIGLTITKKLTELMGGRVGVESTPNMGSTFWLEFELVNHTVKGCNDE